jgi:Na+/melibiose symporter-like transporter
MTRRAKYFRGVFFFLAILMFLFAVLSAVFGGHETYRTCPEGMIGWANRGTYVCFTPMQNSILIGLFWFGFFVLFSHVLYLVWHRDLWPELFPKSFDKDPEKLKHFLFGKDKDREQ